jgi:hypothetical protein
MNPNLPTQAIDTDQYLTVGALLEKIQFDDLSNRIAVCVENPEAMPPSLVTLLVMTPETEEPRQLFVWVPVPGDAVPLAALNGNGWTATSERLPEVGIAVDVTGKTFASAMTATPGKTFAMTGSLRGKRRTLPINPPRRGMGGVQNATIQTATTLSGVFPHRKGDS